MCSRLRSIVVVAGMHRHSGLRRASLLKGGSCGDSSEALMLTARITRQGYGETLVGVDRGWSFLHLMSSCPGSDIMVSYYG